jgi:hypothetical protein
VIGEEERIGGIAELESDGGAGAEGDVGEGAAGIGAEAAEDVEAAGGGAEADGGIKSERAGGSGGEEGVEGMKGVGARHGDTIRKERAGANCGGGGQGRVGTQTQLRIFLLGGGDSVKVGFIFRLCMPKRWKWRGSI